jgi:hypothetical protein
MKPSTGKPKYKCPNPECKSDYRGQKGQRCPECDTLLKASMSTRTKILIGVAGLIVLLLLYSAVTLSTTPQIQSTLVNNTIITPTPTPASTTSAGYTIITVGGLKCEVNSSQAKGQTNQISGRSGYTSPGGNLEIEVYTDPNEYQAVINIVANETGNNKVTQTISGHQVTSYSTTRINGKTYITYFFEVNGKHVRISHEGTSINNHLVESFYNLN